MVNDPTELSRIRRDVLALRDFCIQKASKTSMLSLPRTPALPTGRNEMESVSRQLVMSGDDVMEGRREDETRRVAALTFVVLEEEEVVVEEEEEEEKEERRLQKELERRRERSLLEELEDEAEERRRRDESVEQLIRVTKEARSVLSESGSGSGGGGGGEMVEAVMAEEICVRRPAQPVTLSHSNKSFMKKKEEERKKEKKMKKKKEKKKKEKKEKKEKEKEKEEKEEKEKTYFDFRHQSRDLTTTAAAALLNNVELREITGTADSLDSSSSSSSSSFTTTLNEVPASPPSLPSSSPPTRSLFTDFSRYNPILDRNENGIVAMFMGEIFLFF